VGSSINMRHMRAFTALAEHQHFTKAAEAIHLSQPALTALIKQLEEDLGVQLIRRSTRSMALTDAGREFLASARKLLLDFDDAMKSVSDYRAVKRGSVRIAALPSLCTSTLPVAIKTFREAHPKVKVSILEFFGERVIEAVRERTVDFGLSYWHGEEDIAAEPILADHLIAVGTNKLLGSKSQSLRWKELEGQPIIAMAQGTTIRMLTQSAAMQAGVHLGVVLEPYLLPSAIAYAQAGLGIAIVSSALTPRKISTGLRAVRLVAPAIKRTISIVHLHKSALSPSADAFRRHIVAAVSSNSATIAAPSS
jgi:LysR family transcriptional regulator, carnitine catabolism transcriptional activator